MIHVQVGWFISLIIVVFLFGRLIGRRGMRKWFAVRIQGIQEEMNKMRGAGLKEDLDEAGLEALKALDKITEIIERKKPKN